MHSVEDRSIHSVTAATPVGATRAATYIPPRPPSPAPDSVFRRIGCAGLWFVHADDPP